MLLIPKDYLSREMSNLSVLNKPNNLCNLGTFFF